MRVAGDVIEVPAPLLADDIDHDIGWRRGVSQGPLVTVGVVEEHPDHEDRHDRVEDLHRHVVFQLHGQRRVRRLALVGDHAPDGQAPDQPTDRERGNPRPQPEAADAIGTLGGPLRQVAIGKLALGTGQATATEAQDDTGDSQAEPEPSRRAASDFGVWQTQRAPRSNR